MTTPALPSAITINAQADPAPALSPKLELPPPIAILGVVFDQVTTADALVVMDDMIATGKPHYVVTPNVDFVVQALRDRELRRILAAADLVLCDGMPLVWASRVLGRPLPERVAGSNLVPQLLAQAARNSRRVFFLGGTEASVAQAAKNSLQTYPGLQLVGAYSPPFAPLLGMNHEEILERVRAARPDILLVALGCPKQEKWIGMNYQRAGVPLTLGVGATIDFLAGTMRRAPQWMQRSGLEWLFRLAQEPRRLFHRYATDLSVFGRAIFYQCWKMRVRRSQDRLNDEVVSAPSASGACEVVRFDERIDADTVQRYAALWPQLAAGRNHLLIDLAAVKFIDSAGVGLLVRWLKRTRDSARELILVAPSPAVLAALGLMRLTTLFQTARDLAEARALVNDRSGERAVPRP